MLHTYYAIQISEERMIDGKKYFYDSSSHIYYVTISAENKKAIYMEQAALTYFLVENGYYQTSFPVPNIHGEWFTKYKDKMYLVLKVIQLQERPFGEHGKRLAHFHTLNSAYQYEPQYISSYGQWKQLWIDKITTFEQKIVDDRMEHSHQFHRLLIDILPYIVGMCENAIQYIEETNQEVRFNESDQGTIVFQRYEQQLEQPVIWLPDLAYDHLTRDVAEFIRLKFLEVDDHALEEVRVFMNDYQSVQPLSPFSWRLLYARLIFPVHLLDIIEQSFLTDDLNTHYKKLYERVEHQSMYEERLEKLFTIVEADVNLLNIPQLQWL